MPTLDNPFLDLDVSGYIPLPLVLFLWGSVNTRAVRRMRTLPALGSRSPAPPPPCSHVQPRWGPRDLTLLFVSHAPGVFPLTWDPWECGNGLQSPSPHSEGAMLGVNGNHPSRSSPPSARRTLGLLDGSLGAGTSLLLDPQTSQGHISWDLFLPSQASSWQEPPFLSFLDFFFSPSTLAFLFRLEKGPSIQLSTESREYLFFLFTSVFTSVLSHNIKVPFKLKSKGVRTKTQRRCVTSRGTHRRLGKTQEPGLSPHHQPP